LSDTTITPRQRVLTALAHHEPDRVPVDFLATPEIWKQLTDYFELEAVTLTRPDYLQPEREVILRRLDVDCRVLSYDMFCQPPESVLRPGAVVDWWGAMSRSTPARMWRQRTNDGQWYDIWGHHIRLAHNLTGAYEEFATWPLEIVENVTDLQQFPWPQPDWWDFKPLLGVIQQLDSTGDYHIRFRIGSVFELAWQLRGMQQFLMDLAIEPSIPLYIMDRITETLVENTHRVLELAGDRLDMVYFYDDVATQHSLMMSRGMWEEFIRPYHARLIEVAKAFNKPVMYHCDGALYPLIPALLDMGIDMLNPVQADAKGMEPETLKREFGDRLSFHGGIDIIKTLPRGTTQDVADEVCERVRVLGENGGYILASSHHIQSDTPLENVLEMYRLEHRLREKA
jgi:uroporphyrinogen decarboxylase